MGSWYFYSFIHVGLLFLPWGNFVQKIQEVADEELVRYDILHISSLLGPPFSMYFFLLIFAEAFLPFRILVGWGQKEFRASEIWVVDFSWAMIVVGIGTTEFFVY